MAGRRGEEGGCCSFLAGAMFSARYEGESEMFLGSTCDMLLESCSSALRLITRSERAGGHALRQFCSTGRRRCGWYMLYVPVRTLKVVLPIALASSPSSVGA